MSELESEKEPQNESMAVKTSITSTLNGKGLRDFEVIIRSQNGDPLVRVTAHENNGNGGIGIDDIQRNPSGNPGLAGASSASSLSDLFVTAQVQRKIEEL